MSGARPIERLIAIVGFMVLVVLHLDFWRAPSARVVLGWMPVELGYRLLYIALAWAYMLFICWRLWREPEDDE